MVRRSLFCPGLGIQPTAGCASAASDASFHHGREYVSLPGGTRHPEPDYRSRRTFDLLPLAHARGAESSYDAGVRAAVAQKNNLPFWRGARAHACRVQGRPLGPCERLPSPSKNVRMSANTARKSAYATRRLRRRTLLTNYPGEIQRKSRIARGALNRKWHHRDRFLLQQWTERLQNYRFEA